MTTIYTFRGRNYAVFIFASIPLATPFTCGQHLRKKLLLHLRLDPSFEMLLLSWEANKKSHKRYHMAENVETHPNCQTDLSRRYWRITLTIGAVVESVMVQKVAAKREFEAGLCYATTGKLYQSNSKWVPFSN